MAKIIEQKNFWAIELKPTTDYIKYRTITVSKRWGILFKRGWALLGWETQSVLLSKKSFANKNQVKDWFKRNRKEIIV